MLSQTCPRAPRRRTIGTMTPVLPGSDPYPAGQYFLHKTFGYRGVIVYGWNAELSKTVCTSDHRGGCGRRFAQPSPPVTASTADPFPTKRVYQSIIEVTDVGHDKSLRTFHASTGWDHCSGRLLSGLDFVTHDDVLPFHAESPRHFFSANYPEHGAKGSGDVRGLFEALFTFRINPMVHPLAVHTDLGHGWAQLARQAIEDTDLFTAISDSPAVEMTMLPIPMLRMGSSLKSYVTGRKGDRTPQMIKLEPVNLAAVPPHELNFTPGDLLLPPLPRADVQSPERLGRMGGGEFWHGWAVQSKISLRADRNLKVKAFEWETRDDQGVVNGGTHFGTQPNLTSATPAAQHTFAVGLATPAGRLNGMFTLELNDGTLAQIVSPEVILS